MLEASHVDASTPDVSERWTAEDLPSLRHGERASTTMEGASTQPISRQSHRRPKFLQNRGHLPMPTRAPLLWSGLRTHRYPEHDPATSFRFWLPSPRSTWRGWMTSVDCRCAEHNSPGRSVGRCQSHAGPNYSSSHRNLFEEPELTPLKPATPSSGVLETKPVCQKLTLCSSLAKETLRIPGPGLDISAEPNDDHWPASSTFDGPTNLLLPHGCRPMEVALKKVCMAPFEEGQLRGKDTRH